MMWRDCAAYWDGRYSLSMQIPPCTTVLVSPYRPPIRLIIETGRVLQWNKGMQTAEHASGREFPSLHAKPSFKCVLFKSDHIVAVWE